MTTNTANAIEGFGGEVIAPHDPGYDGARRIWNEMFDRRPALIARCTSAEDVVAAIAFARSEGIPLSVRAGGHSLAGHSICEDGLVVDISLMKGVDIDPAGRRVRAAGGCLLRTLDDATLPHGLVVPAGVVSHTGLGGLTLGGGFGHLTRKYGLSIDSLVSAEVVLADGTIVRTNRDELPDLFWAIRGGSGNFGVVTEFEFEMHPVGPIVVGSAFHSLERARPVLERWREEAVEAADELNWVSLLRWAPRLDWVGRDLVDKPGLIKMIEWSGDVREGQDLVSRLLAEIEPEASNVDVMAFGDLQTMYDDAASHGNLAYGKAGFMNAVTDDVVDVLLEYGARVPSWRSQIELFPMGGAFARIPHEATAFGHRDARWMFNILSMWEDPDATDVSLAWARDLYAAAEPYLNGGAYVNTMGGDESGGSNTAYGGMLDKLRAIKGVYDPENIFFHNQNIAPAAVASGGLGTGSGAAPATSGR